MIFRKDIQGFRAVAFLLVFIFHLNKKWLPGGFLGVDIFFVISGYLMARIITEQINKGTFNFVEFTLNRIRRIVPAYYIFLFVTIFLLGYIYLYDDIVLSVDVIISALRFNSNVFFSSGQSYFGAAFNENPFLHTWSLSIEMQFYLLLPLLLFFFRKNTILVLSILSIVFTVYACYYIYFLKSTGSVYFSLVARIPEFLIGSLFSLKFKNGLKFKKNTESGLVVLCLIIVLISVFFINEESAFPGILAFVFCIAIAFILSSPTSIISQQLDRPFWVYLGELSYSLYLWHFPIMALMRYTNDRYEFTIPEIFFIIVLTFFLSYISYELVEKRTRKLDFKVVLPVLIVIAVSLGAYAKNLNIIYIDKKIDEEYSSYMFGHASHSKMNIEKFGDKASNKTILLIGDSIASSLKTFFDTIGKRHSFSIETLTTSSFPALKGINRDEIRELYIPQYDQSLNFIAVTDSLIQKHHLIILAVNRLDENLSRFKAIEDLCKSLKPDQKLVLINSYPILKSNPLKVNGGIYKKNTSGGILPDETMLKNEFLENISNKYSNVYIYNLDDVFIRKDLGYVEDTVAYYDKIHLNYYGLQKMAHHHEKPFMQFLKQIEGSF